MIPTNFNLKKDVYFVLLLLYCLFNLKVIIANEDGSLVVVSNMAGHLERVKDLEIESGVTMTITKFVFQNGEAKLMDDSLVYFDDEVCVKL